ncbi:MAG: UbiX family flavin prenyltransferase [Thermoprotei archaeon]|nr:UbiX family flavin prenyltransferase [TACK group archaeon]
MNLGEGDQVVNKLKLPSKKRLVLAITGASGMPYVVAALRYLKDKRDLELHCVISKAGELVMRQEVGWNLEELKQMTDHLYEETDLAAPIASGSFQFEAMLVMPCSTKTLSSIANGYSFNLISRAAEVALKEGRKLVLVIRESPLSLMDVENMEKVIQAGGTIMPASPAFYTHPRTLEDAVNFVAGRALSAVGIENNLYQPWLG